MFDARARNNNLIVCFLFLSLSHPIYGEDNMLLTKYRWEIENYIMTGSTVGGKQCDVIHDLSGPQQPSLFNETPMFVLDIDQLHTLDIQTTFSSSICLLISAHVKTNQSLSDLIKFGWSVVQHKRLALVLKLSPGFTLEMATNTTKLPFLVAARMEEGKEQFLCPVIGEANPRLQNVKCNLTYTSSKNKSLRVAMFGMPPNCIFGKLST